MSHPKDKRERFLVGKNLGEKRVSGYFGRAAGFRSEKERIDFLEKNAQQRRNTTKPCSCSMCGNPRRVSWSKKDKLTMQEKKFNEALMKD